MGTFTYRKKPVEIEAYQLDDDGGEQTTAMPQWFVQEITDGRILPTNEGGLNIHTLEGVMNAQPGDFIIRGIKGEIYPCKPDIFFLTYDKV